MGEKSRAWNPWTPCRAAYRPTEAVKNDRMTIRAQAPAVGSHLPTRKETTADPTVSQMKPRANPYLAAPCSGVTKSPKAVTAPMRRPQASRVHTYGPPSSGNDDPSSAVSSP